MVDPNMAMAMATELPQTPPKQLAPKFTPADIPGAAIAVANAPVTPGPSTSTTTDATATATAITPVISPETPSSQASTSTDRSILATPGGTTPACSIIMSEYKVKTVRTAKCTECDKRNTSKMLACPGCTFQLCEGCVTRRMADQRGMVHGQVDTSLSPPMERVVRRRTVWSKDPATPATPKSEGNDAGEAAGGNEDGVASESSGGKGKQKAEGVSSSTKRKQAARKKAQKGDETNLEGDDFMHESPVPNASKRRRTNVPGPAFPLPSDELPSGQPVVRRRYKITPTKKNAAPVPDGPLSPRSGGPLKTIPPGVNLKEISAAEHLDMMGIKQDEPLLGRQMPVFYHTPMRIPGKLLKYNKPSSPAGSQVGEKSSSLATEEKNNEAKMLQAKQNHVYMDPGAITVRSVVEREAQQWLSDTRLSGEDKNIIYFAQLSEARLWAVRTWKKMESSTRLLAMRNGMDMRLDMVDDLHTNNLVSVLRECVTSNFRDLMEQKNLEAEESAL